MWWFIGLGLVLAATVAGVIVWQIQPTSYYAIRPGSVKDTTEIIQVDGAESFDPEGEIGFTTVSVLQNITRWEKRRFSDDPTVTIVDESVINGDNTADEKREIDRQRMENSMDIATLVALEYLGYETELVGSGAEVRDVLADLPVSAALEIDDVITALDGEPIRFSDELVAGIRSRGPGDIVQLTVERGGEALTVSVELADNPADAGNALLGVSVTTHDLRAEAAVDVSFDVGTVGGPSAGLAFALGVIDVLTPGELTGGQIVATTGQILPDGSVGPVGGVAQKAVAAREYGADLFIVPSTEYEVALTQSGDMRVEIADSLEEALEVLDGLGGNGLALGPERADDQG